MATRPARFASPFAAPSSIRQGGHICLNGRNILGRTIVDNQTIVFRMNDGSYWRNSLQKPCAGLAIADSFDLVHPDAYICSDQQRITVGRHGSFCWLGTFERTTGK